MFTSEKELIESRGYVIMKISGTEYAFKHPKVFTTNKQPKPEAITKGFLQLLKTKRIMVLTPRNLAGKSAEERELMVLELMK